MNMERMRRVESESVLPLSHGKVQAKLAEYAFQKEHPGVTVGRNDIMMDWIREHAGDWREVVEEHADEKISVDDPNVIARFYEEMMRKHGGSDSTTLH